MFRALLVLLALTACASARTPWHQLESKGYDFAQYQLEFGKTYESATEAMARQEIFTKNLQAILEHNKKDLSWKNGVNHLTDRTESELKTLRGHKKALSHQAKLKGTTEKHVKTGKSIPDTVDYRNTGAVSAIKDQGQCGSCWTFASAATIESQWYLQSGKITDLSTQQIASCTENPQDCGGTGGCEGGTAEVAFASIIANGGIASEYTYPYISWGGNDAKCKFPNNKTQMPMVKLSSYKTITTNSYEDFIDAIANVGPLAISVDASAWSAYESGIFDGCNQSSPDLDHAVQVVGYGTENSQPYWIVRNSWTPDWGEKGYIRLRRDTGNQRCGTDSNPSDGSGCNGGPTTVTVCGTCGILYDNCYPVIAAGN